MCLGGVDGARFDPRRSGLETKQPRLEISGDQAFVQSEWEVVGHGMPGRLLEFPKRRNRLACTRSSLVYCWRRMTQDVLGAIQWFTARAAIGSSSMRGAAAGTVPAARDFLGQISLEGFGTANSKQFRVCLDTATNDLLRRLPKGGRSWGRARKGVNIFLRGCLYTCYLRDEYRLDRAEEFFEMPLDSITGAKIVRESKKIVLPQWDTVRDLDLRMSGIYQDAAAILAAEKGISRVHLDAMWWGRRTDGSGRLE
jgi:hypothetical protein